MSAFIGSLFAPLGSLLASVIWLGVSILLVIQGEGISLEMEKVGIHFMGGYSIVFIAVLIYVDIFIDVCVLRINTHILNARPRWRTSIFVSAFLVFVLTVVGDVMVNHYDMYRDAVTITVILTFLILFLVRMVSYINVRVVKKV